MGEVEKVGLCIPGRNFTSVEKYSLADGTLPLQPRERMANVMCQRESIFLWCLVSVIKQAYNGEI